MILASTDPADTRRLGLHIAIVFVVATALTSQCLVWVSSRLQLDSEALSPVQYGPALAALVTWLIFRDRIGSVMPAAVSSRQLRVHASVGVAASGLFAIVLWIGYSLIGTHGISGVQAIDGVPFWLIAIVWLCGAAAEEVGWRGVLQPALETRLPRWGAGIVTGLLWSIWHLPVIVLGAAVAIAFIASTTVLAVMLAYLGNGSPAQRVITTSLVHWLVNLAILIIAGSRTDLAVLIPELVAIALTATVVISGFMWCRNRARDQRA